MRLGRGDVRRPRIMEIAARATALGAAVRRDASLVDLGTIGSGGLP